METSPLASEKITDFLKLQYHSNTHPYLTWTQFLVQFYPWEGILWNGEEHSGSGKELFGKLSLKDATNLFKAHVFNFHMITFGWYIHFLASDSIIWTGNFFSNSFVVVFNFLMLHVTNPQAFMAILDLKLKPCPTSCWGCQNSWMVIPVSFFFILGFLPG